MAATLQADTASTEPAPVKPPALETTVMPTRVCPQCGSGRMIVIGEIPPLPKAARTRAGLEPCLTLDSS